MSFQTRLQSATKSVTGFHRNVYVAYTCTFFFGFLFFGGVFQVLVNLLLVRLGFDPQFVGLLNGMVLLFVSVGSVFGAILGQRFSSTSLLRAGYGLFFVGMVLFPLGNYFPPAMQRSWFLITYSFAALMAAVYVVHMQPIFMASTKDEERNRVFSYQAALMTIGGFCGSWFAGSLSTFLISRFSLSVDSPLPYTWTLLVAAALAIIGVIATFFVRDARPAQSQRAEGALDEATENKDPFPLKIILLVALVVSLRIVGESATRSFSNLYLDLEFGIDPARIAYIFSVAQFLAIPAPLIAPGLMTRYGRAAVFNWATVAVAGCVIFIAFAQHWLWVAIGFILVMGLAQIARPAITILSLSSVSPKWQASMSSSNIISIGLSGLGTSLMAGLMIDSVGFRPFYLIAAAITLAGVAAFRFGFLKNTKAV